MTDSDVTSMVERIGGSATIDLLVDRFYDLMELEPDWAELRALRVRGASGTDGTGHSGSGSTGSGAPDTDTTEAARA